MGEPSFRLFGFIMCVGATAARALKSVVQGILLSSEGEKLNSMNLLLYMAPIAVVLLLPATLYMEENVVGILLALARDDIRIIWLLLFNSALAYFVNLTNFLVTKHTSALTLQVKLAVDSVIMNAGAEKKEQVASWTADTEIISKHAMDLKQLDNIEVCLNVPRTGVSNKPCAGAAACGFSSASSTSKDAQERATAKRK